MMRVVTMPPVLCAVDLGPLTGRVLYHAFGISKVLGAPLRIVHVTDDDAEDVRARVIAECERAAPYEVDIDGDAIVVVPGNAAEAIHREALEYAAGLIVTGSSSHGGLARLFLGSTSEALLAMATRPVLLVPPTEFDIVNLSSRTLTCGPIVVPVDLEAECDEQLQLASRLAQLAAQTLILMTVANDGISDHDAAARLRARAHGLTPVKPRSLIVRRGDVPEEISRCAVAEDSGLVVMGIRQAPRGRPGGIATAVLKTGRAFVLAVPGK